MKKLFFRLAGLLVLLGLLAGLCPGFAPVRAASPSIQEGVTLHCWNWSFKSIESNMAAIARQGYTAIQTSPIQQAKQATAGYPYYDWWVYYQPAAFAIDNTGKSALGTKAEFASMCRTAHEYGIKVIVDVVANHMGDNGSNRKSPAILDDIEKDASCWHDISKNTYDYSKRYDVTQWCLSGLPDLNTGSPKVQNYVLGFLKECIDAGADGFRFDAAKHIETPEDGRDNCASNFWPNVIGGATDYAKSKGITLYCYGELLDSPGGNLSVSAYTKYMSITDNTWSNAVRNSVVGGRNAGAFSYQYHKNASANKLVLWAESHDNYAGDGSSGMSTQDINKAWALVAARADAMSLYLARPTGYSQKLGTAAGNTGWANKEVAAVNKFHTAMAGKSEYVATEGNIAYVERGSQGVVLVNCSGTSGSVNVRSNTLKKGTYTDQITGNRFTVSDGRIKGNIGSTGIAVVYNATPEVTPQDITLYLTGAGNWNPVNCYAWYTGGSEITASWPGNPMEKVSGLYRITLPADTVNVIFNNGSDQTEDLLIPAGKNCYDLSTKQWSVYTPEAPKCTHPEHNQSGKCTKCGVSVGHRYDGQGLCACGIRSPGLCPHSAHDQRGICTLCGTPVSHKYENGSCACGLTQNISCAHGRHGKDGVCPDCGKAEVHAFVAGKCYCGAVQDVPPQTTQPEETVPPTTVPVPEETVPPTTIPVPEETVPSTAPTQPDDTHPSTDPLPTEPQEPSSPVPVVLAVVFALLVVAGVIVFIKKTKKHSD